MAQETPPEFSVGMPPSELPDMPDYKAGRKALTELSDEMLAWSEHLALTRQAEINAWVEMVQEEKNSRQATNQ